MRADSSAVVALTGGALAEDHAILVRARGSWILKVLRTLHATSLRR